MAKEGIVIETHIKKSPEVLLKAAKKNGGMPKGVWGIMTVEGQIIRIDPINDKIPGQLPKLAKKYFSERGLKFRLEITEPQEEDGDNSAGSNDDNASAQTEGEEQTESGSAEQDRSADVDSDAAVEGEEDPSNSDKAQRKTIKKWMDGNKKKIMAVMKNRDSENGKAMTSALKDYTNALKAGNLDEAEAAQEEVGAVLDKADDEFTLTDQQRAAIMKDLGKMEKEISELSAKFA